MEEQKNGIRSHFLSIVIDKKMKTDFTDLCKRNGLDFSFANARFIKQCLIMDDIPFNENQIRNYKQSNQNQDLVRCSIRISQDERDAFKLLCKAKNAKMIDILKLFMETSIQKNFFSFSN